MQVKKYYASLPRKANQKIRCQNLLENGNRCRKLATTEVSAHLDNEIYDRGIYWVSFYVCAYHAETIEK